MLREQCKRSGQSIRARGAVSLLSAVGVSAKKQEGRLAPPLQIPSPGSFLQAVGRVLGVLLDVVGGVLDVALDLVGLAFGFGLLVAGDLAPALLHRALRLVHLSS